MELLDLVLIGFVSVYALIVFFITIGMYLLPTSTTLSKKKTKSSVSVIVSAKNEELDIPACIASLEKLTYPKDLLEVILVDDQSTDNTQELIKQAVDRNPHFKFLSTIDAPKNKLRAKAKGIAWGIKNTNAEWIFITDADGSVHPNWIEHMLSGTDETTGMIGGMVMVKPRSFLAIIERISWAYTLPFAFGMAGFGGGFICVGPNMGLRKSIYDDAGGLENATFDVAEDLALFRMVDKSPYGVKSYISQETKVELEPVPSFKHLFSQQRRWLKGGFEGGWKYWIGLVAGFGLHNILSILLVFALITSPITFLIAFSIKGIADFSMFLSERILLKEQKIIRYFFLAQLSALITFIWLPISLLINSTIRWMGDDYTITYDS